MLFVEVKETNHFLTGSLSNYYIGNYNGENFGLSTFEDWGDFCMEYPHITHEDTHTYTDYFYRNLLIRYDIYHQEDAWGNDLGGFQLHLFFVLQEKGIYKPIVIENIVEEDMPAINRMLNKYWEVLKDSWKEISK